MPIDYKEYDENWKIISKGIIDDANGKCELCGAPNGETVARPTNLGWNISYPWVSLVNKLLKYEDHRKVKIVLTVHHIDGNKKNNSRHNLLALCQRCHLKLDMGKHINNRRKNKSKSQVELELNRGL